MASSFARSRSSWSCGCRSARRPRFCTLRSSGCPGATSRSSASRGRWRRCVAHAPRAATRSTRTCCGSSKASAASRSWPLRATSVGTKSLAGPAQPLRPMAQPCNCPAATAAASTRAWAPSRSRGGGWRAGSGGSAEAFSGPTGTSPPSLTTLPSILHQRRSRRTSGTSLLSSTSCSRQSQGCEPRWRSRGCLWTSHPRSG
mmetsp:Transcript_53850/g.149486  ORF Transcript_53850/g.149486 Transcript_53850/m.149486 type:complete len:201 (-) Transcript_53850:1466-2068(-)